MMATDDLWDGQQAGRGLLCEYDIGGGLISACFEDGLMGV